MKNIIELLELNHDETENINALDDFCIEPESGGEYRLIREDVIDEIFFEEIMDLVMDCYDFDFPDFVVIDWQATVHNCRIEGFGHHFSHYDGSEEHLDGYYIFRIN